MTVEWSGRLPSRPAPRQLSDVDRMRTVLARFLAQQLITADQYQDCRVLDRRFANGRVPTFMEMSASYRVAAILGMGYVNDKVHRITYTGA